MNMQLFCALAMLIFALAGCSPEPPEETVFDAQLETLERARQVEGQIQDHADKIDQQLRDSVDSDPPQ